MFHFSFIDFCKYMLILNLTPATRFQVLGTEATKD